MHVNISFLGLKILLVHESLHNSTAEAQHATYHIKN